MKKPLLSAILLVSAAMPALADNQAAAPVSLSTPSMYGPLNLNANPYNIDLGDPIGKIYGGGILSGLGVLQNHSVQHNDNSLLDLSNGQVFVQKADGLLQFYVQAGAYTQTALGTPYTRIGRTTDETFGAIPIAYAKIAPNDNFSIQAGKLYTLIGTENTFTFQNANIERGLLWNQTNAVSRGVQANYSQGNFSGSFAITDGFYSDKLDWLSGLITYTIDKNNSITFIGSGNFDHSSKSTFATPLAQDNSQIYDLSYNFTTGPWTLTPTLQYTYVPKDTGVGLTDHAATYGAGLTTKYAINSNWSIAGRAEYIDSTGGTNVTYGPGSNALSLTFTPTYQQGIFFARAEGSYVKVTDTTSGSAFGTNGNETSQARLLFETGVLF